MRGIFQVDIQKNSIFKWVVQLVLIVHWHSVTVGKLWGSLNLEGGPNLPPTHPTPTPPHPNLV